MDYFHADRRPVWRRSPGPDAFAPSNTGPWPSPADLPGKPARHHRRRRCTSTVYALDNLLTLYFLSAAEMDRLYGPDKNNVCSSPTTSRFRPPPSARSTKAAGRWNSSSSGSSSIFGSSAACCEPRGFASATISPTACITNSCMRWGCRQSLAGPEDRYRRTLGARQSPCPGTGARLLRMGPHGNPPALSPAPEAANPAPASARHRQANSSRSAHRVIAVDRSAGLSIDDG